jgi:hypothetical protein
MLVQTTQTERERKVKEVIEKERRYNMKVAESSRMKQIRMKENPCRLSPSRGK